MTMKALFVFAVFSAAVFFQPAVARAEHTRVTYPSALGVEALGRGMAWSFFFDRVLDDQLVAGIGFGSVGVQSAGAPDEFTATIPVYANFYFQKEQGSLYLTGGATIVSGSARGELSTGNIVLDKGVIPTFGLGYENRSDAGFLFRATAYGVLADKLYPWFGLSLGYTF